LIAFSSDQDGDFEGWVMNADGTSRRKLADNDATDWSPAWSPDGALIAFVSNRDGNDEIYILRADAEGQIEE
jgi:TolB protein